MRRIRAGVARKGEWMADDAVVQQVRNDYLQATRWIHDHMLAGWSHQWQVAPRYLSGKYLKRFQTILTQHRATQQQFVGVLRADHQIVIRHFSENGESCLVVDYQAQRRMATYDVHTGERVQTQDLGDGALVYRMIYDLDAGRWKIAEFVQELPAGWGKGQRSRRIRELAVLPTSIGRDN
jgi:hypothetical protein